MVGKFDPIIAAGKAIAPLVNESLRLRDELVTARDDALEEAAKVADEHLRATCTGMGSETAALRLGAESIAAAIRAMKGKDDA